MTASATSRLRSAFTENINLKLLSVAFALVLYSLVHGGKDAKRSIVVDLEAKLPPEHSNRELVTQLPQSVRITVRGTNSTIDELRASSMPLQLDLTSGTETHVNLEARMLRLPAGVKVDVVEFEPASVDLTWEERIVRDVPVQVSVVGTPAVGFVVKGMPNAEPRTVRLRGPKSEVSVLQHVRADAFDVTGLTEGSYPRQLVIDRTLTRLHPSPVSVLVTAEIMREIAERQYSKLPVAVVGQARGRVQPVDVDVRLVCPPDILRGLRAEQIVPRVEVTSKEPSGSESLPVKVAIEKCEAHVTPESVIVRW